MKRILIIRPSAIGDVVFASPLAASLRQTYPDAFIAWLAEPSIAKLLEADPHLDKVLVWSKQDWKKLWQQKRYAALWAQVRLFRQALRSYQFDTALELQGLMKGAFLAKLSGAATRISLGGREGSGLLSTQVIPRTGLPGRMGGEYLHLAQMLKLSEVHFWPQLHIAPSVEERSLALQREYNLQPQRYVALAPFTTRPQKHWFEAHWRTLLPKLIQELHLKPVILGGPDNQKDAAALVQDLPEAINLAGKTSLPEAATLIRDAALLIGVDNGLTHMGAAFTTPTLALSGSSCPYRDAGRDNFKVLYLGLNCSPCRRRPTCNGAFNCMADLQPAQVFVEAQALCLQKDAK